MARLASGLCAMALLTAGSAALAAEPLKLSDQALDTVTAGAEAGASLDASAATGSGGSVVVIGGVRRTDSGPLGVFTRAESDGAGGKTDDVDVIGPTPFSPFVLSYSDSDVGSAAARISGNVTVTDRGLLTTAVGFFVGETATTGEGQARVAASGFTQGGTEVINETNSFSVGNQTYFVTMAAVLN